MYVTSISHLDHHEPHLTVQMTATEAGYIAQLIGGFNSETDPVAIRRNDPAAHRIGSEIYDSITGEFFNRLYEDGVKDFLRGKSMR